MEQIKETGEYEFTKKIQMEYAASFIKVIKITKNWKVIGYFKNKSLTEGAVELSMKKGILGEIWMVRNKKTIYRNGKENEENRKGGREKVKKADTTKEKVSRTHIPEPCTPPGQILKELGNMASKGRRQQTEAIKDSDTFSDLLKTHSPKKLESPQKVREFYQLLKSLTDDEVVEMVNQWRLDSNKEDEDSDVSDKKVGNTKAREKEREGSIYSIQKFNQKLQSNEKFERKIVRIG
ncbi:hypothetical protein C1646_728736 [Rhizophagus diaphanus]|nr:hypothetical protein C1646_728736 [Rhizophagus diaphanus] [Rhizophagus sp. MUCL 43196]